MSVKAQYIDGAFRPLEEVVGAAPGKIYCVYEVPYTPLQNIFGHSSEFRQTPLMWSALA